MTRRERLEAKLERRREWAESRQTRASREWEKGDLREEKSGIPFGQPILVGHHSEGRHRRAIERAEGAMRRCHESVEMAHHHQSKAAGLEDQLASTIYSDDPDAVDALESKVAALEDLRNRIKAYNASARKAAKAGEKFGNLELLDERQKTDLLRTFAACPYHYRAGGPFPAYHLTNLSANIKRNRDRIEIVKRDAAKRAAAEESPDGYTIAGGDWVNVTFADKPDREILQALKAAGFRWGRGSWTGRREDLPEMLK